MMFSTPLYQRSSYELSRDISWSQHSSRGYVLRDPMNKDELLYLTPGEYQKLVSVALTTHESIEVIATPRDTPASIARKFPAPSEGHTTPIESMGRGETSWLFPMLPGWARKGSMIAF